MTDINNKVLKPLNAPAPRHSMRAQLIAIQTAVLFCAVPAFGWDIPGHIIVTQVAHSRLNPKAKAKLEQLAPSLVFKTHHYNAGNIAAWADNIKHADASVPHHGHFRHWHYIDLGCKPNDPDLLGNPPTFGQVGGDVVNALKRCVKVVKGQSDPFIPDEAVAVGLITHLVGDIHQPLHCTTHYFEQQGVDPGHESDPPGHNAGGNEIKISNFNNQYPNLHQFWDTAYRNKRKMFGGIVTDPSANFDTFQVTLNDPQVSVWVQTVLQSAPPASVSLKADFEAWAKETHALGCSDAFGKLSGSVETTPRSLSRNYVSNARQLAQKRLCLAGFRLAALLNELYPAQ